MLGGPGSPVLSGIDIEIDQTDVPSMVDGAMITENADGSSVVDLAPVSARAEEPQEHGANLAEYLDPSDRAALGQQLCEAIDDDLKSRAEWEESLNAGMEQLGVKIDDRTYPFNGACGVYDPMMAFATLRWNATGFSQLLPADGPVKTKIVGYADEERYAKAARKRAWFNLYLTQLAPEYYPDFDQMLFWLPLVGSTFKKVYQDPILGRPVSPFITPTNFVVSYTTNDLWTSPRATHLIEMTRRDMKMMQLMGVYRDIELGLADETSEKTALQQATDSAQGVTPTLYQGDDRYSLRESHVDWDLKGFEHRIASEDETDAPSGLPLPYRVTVDNKTKEVLAIYRNWKEGDERFRKKQSFVQYKFLPGLGFYGFGYAHILGGSAKAATSLRRQLIDSGTLNNFPGGLRVKGMKFEDNNMGIGPTEFREVDTGGLPIQSAIMTMPYKEPSPVLLEMLSVVDAGADRLAGTQEIAVGDGRQDAPVGTTMALMEASQKLQSVTVKRTHVSFRQELALLDECFAENMPEEPHQFPVAGGVEEISKVDFGDDVEVIPVSDPNITSSAQRVIIAEQAIKGAQQAPQIHDQREVWREYYEALEYEPERIAKILPKPQQAQPMDPLSENMALMTGRPVAVGPTQDDTAHIKVHSPLLEASPNPMVQQAAQAHIAEHMAAAMRKKVEAILGIQLPQPGTQLPPEIENEIAVLVSKAMQAIRDQEEAKNPTEQQLAMEALRIEASKVAEKAKESQGKLTLGAYQARLKFETSRLDREARLRGDVMKAKALSKRPAAKPAAKRSA